MCGALHVVGEPLPPDVFSSAAARFCLNKSVCPFHRAGGRLHLLGHRKRAAHLRLPQSCKMRGLLSRARREHGEQKAMPHVKPRAEIVTLSQAAVLSESQHVSEECKVVRHVRKQNIPARGPLEDGGNDTGCALPNVGISSWALQEQANSGWP